MCSGICNAARTGVSSGSPASPSSQSATSALNTFILGTAVRTSSSPTASSTRSISLRNQLSCSASNASGPPSHYTRPLPLVPSPTPCPASRTPYRALNLRLSWNSILPRARGFRSLPMFSARGGRPVGPAESETTLTHGKFKPLLPPTFAPPPLDHRLPPRTPVRPQIKGAISRESNYAS